MSNRRQRKSRSKVHIKEVTIELGNKRLSFLLADMIQIFMAVMACLSFIGVLLTLNEMRKDRDAAYNPAVLMNAADFQISWDANGEENWLSSLPKNSDGSYEVNEDGSITGTFSLPVNIFPNGELESFTTVNIGIGTARDICFEWDQNNLLLLTNYLSVCNPSKSNFCTFDKSVAFSFGGRLIVTNIEQSSRLMYMLPDATETYILPLPMAYSILIHETMKCTSLPENLHIILYVEYSDIQGKRSRDAIYIAINRIYFENDADGSGAAAYQLAPSLLIE